MKCYLGTPWLLLLLASPALSQNVDNAEEDLTESEIATKEAINADIDGSLDDSTSSIDIREIREGISLSGDVRVDYSYSETDDGPVAAAPTT